MYIKNINRVCKDIEISKYLDTIISKYHKTKISKYRERNTMGKPTVIATTQRKRGVLKTTTTVHIAAALAMYHDKKVAIIDNDHQANTSDWLLAPDVEVKNDVSSLYFNGDLEDAAYPSIIPNLDIIPSSIDLSITELRIVGEMGREQLLRNALDCKYAEKYDYIFIDTAPSLSPLVMNALTAADKLLIPVSGYLSLTGMSTYLEVLNDVKKKLNPNLEIGGVILTMFNPREVIDRNIKEEVDAVFKDRVFNTTIPKCMKLKISPVERQTVYTLAPKSTGAVAYKKLTKEFVSRMEA
jgi:chromosome partitioning protein